MSEKLYFMPWVRRGMGSNIALIDLGQTSLPADIDIPAKIDIDGEVAERTLSLRGPTHAKAISDQQIARRYPAPGTADAEYDYFPHIEFSAQDLPWVLSPTMADSSGKLRPWVLLICVENSKCTLSSSSVGVPSQLLVNSKELPDPAETWAWGHLQSVVPFATIQSAIDAAGGRVISRLVCPRRLQPGKSYRAAVVNGWKLAADQLIPSWGDTSKDVTLDVFDTWTFSTGDAGSFEELCERLAPVPAKTLTLGANPMDIQDLGILDTFAGEDEIIVDYTGALLDAGTTPKPLPPGEEAAYLADLTKHLDQSRQRPVVKLSDPDPVVTAPRYGEYAIGHDVPLKAGQWYSELNLSPRRRTAAGIGAGIVRKNQERYMARAWDQVGPIREANRVINTSRLQAEIGRTWKQKVDTLNDFEKLSILRPQASFVRDSADTPIRRKIRTSSLPTGILSPSFMRRIRPSSVSAKTLNSDAYYRVIPGQEPSNKSRPNWRAGLVTQLKTPLLRRRAGIGVVKHSSGTRLTDMRRFSVLGLPIPHVPVLQVALSDTFRLTQDSKRVIQRLKPVKTSRKRLENRISGLATLLADSSDEELPTQIQAYPEIDDALVWDVMEMSTELVSPGINDFPQNAVRLLEAEPGFVAAVLAGANHEFTRELLWREYPARPGGTAFKRFWDRPDPTLSDIRDMQDWPLKSPLSDLGTAGVETAVLLVRGDLIRQYPGVRILLLGPKDSVAQEPSFVGRIPSDIRFLGFDVPDLKDLTSADSEYKIIFEEPPGEPRFGLDAVSDHSAQTLSTYNDLAWNQIEPVDATYLRIADQAALSSNTMLRKEARWGLNAAHMALATYQRPYRRVFWARDLLGESAK
jgi:hypothetical protein